MKTTDVLPAKTSVRETNLIDYFRGLGSRLLTENYNMGSPLRGEQTSRTERSVVSSGQMT